ncbi:MAG: hypothetical protein ACREI2_08140 [Nitrospiraceae bacterium]
MPQKDLEKLLGGYATNTLTEAERRALFEAALTDQTLFIALAKEQALKELLDDPHSRRRILDVLERSSPSPAQSWIVRGLDWLRRPSSLALSGSLASAVVAVIALGHLLIQVGPRTTESLLTADARRSVSSTGEARPSAPAKQASPKAKTPSAQSVGGLQTEKKVERMSQPAVEPTQETASNTRLAKADKVPPLPSREPAPEADQKSSALKPAMQPPALAAPFPPKEAQQGLGSAPHPASPEVTPAEPEEEATVPIPTDLLPSLERQKSASSPGREQRKARALFYAQAEPARSGAGKAGEEQMERPMVAQAPKAEAESAAPRVGFLGKVEAPTPVRNQPIGLRYSILKQGKEGVETEADPAERFEASATLKLTVEVNAPGFLYVLKRDPSRIWTVLYPSTEQKETTAAPDPRMESRTRLEFPLTSAVTAKDQPVRTEAFILYSRQAQPDLHSIIALITGDPRQGGARAALIDAFIQRARRNAELQHFLIQRVDGTKKGAPKERAVYVVDPAPDPSSPMFVEITVSQQ